MIDKTGRLLVVDDNRMNRLKLSGVLKQQGHTVLTAENGRQALEMIHGQAFDVILLDIIMPEMDGYGVLESLKKDSSFRDIPVIVISALDEMDSIAHCIKMGAEDYLLKPFDPVLLKARIDASLEKKRLRDQEIEYLKHVSLLTDAAAAIEAEMFEPDSLLAVRKRKDELGRLARVFQRMAKEIHLREQKLKQEVQQLRIELDAACQAQQVAEITDSDYFQQLQSKAQDLRKIIDGS
ncbi:MAG TPA: response regulator [candidate division Zixibacteria bacterium]|nr:response regulator [candidate division Zixibacteria bacterium]